ncbi:fibronectin type 3 domain-containing protein [Neobacillus bataviensis]|uniref:Fibronectin type 3 domain-containing protein n=1 Tax=Neobacillus bataviensis TaxID=220685 RepID=A0A561CAT1_9BACI|nr:fibronectin type 3 domain-containing protein [Neobacillus bataviensis]
MVKKFSKKKLPVVVSSALILSMFSGIGTVTPKQTHAAELTSLKFDFGSSVSPVAKGYTQVTNNMIYSSERGYGLNKAVDFRDRGAPDDLRRDFINGTNYTFSVDVSNGEYYVSVITGDNSASNKTSFTVEGQSLGTISTSAGNFAEKSKIVTVQDGQLNVDLGDNGRVNAIEIIAMAAPSGLALTEKNLFKDTTVSLKWDEVEGATSYNVYRKAEGDTASIKVGTTSTPEFKDETVQLGLKYEYSVTQVNEKAIESAKSTPINVALVDETKAVPKAPTGTTLIKSTDKSLTFHWNGSEDTLMYYVYRSKSPQGPFERVGISKNGEFSDQSVSPTRHYYYRVSAVNLGGISDPSNTIETPITKLVQRQMEKLNRGLVAVKVENGVYVGWRMLGTDPEGVAFNVYRDGQKVNKEPITSSTNFLDNNGTKDSKYDVRAVFNGNEEPLAEAATTVWGQNYYDLPIQKPEGGTTPDGKSYTYSANDASVGDVDGDGQYEIILKWYPSNAKDNSQSGYTGNTYVDAYKFDGTRLWRIDLGKNIRSGAHYTQMMVYDLDGDGKAEVAMKTADGTVDGQGTVIGDANADYRNSSGYVLSGPEFLTVFDGLTGKALTTTDYDPPRGNVADWGDSYGNRVDRFLAGIAYLDGERPSLIMARGYYTRAVIAAYNWRDGKLTKVWTFDSNKTDNGEYAGQGYHNLSVADVDQDGKDEIVYGAAVIDDNGTGLYTTGLGHGDAQHVGDLDPTRPGLEMFAVHEDKSAKYGIEFRDVETGKAIWGNFTGRDTGRGLSADIDPRYPGEESWAVGGAWNDPTGDMFTAQGERISSDIPGANFAIWWDGDLQREILDHAKFNDADQVGVGTIGKWDYENKKLVNILTADGTFSNNGTKGNPSLQADLMGDWREEVIWRTEDSSALRIFTSTDVTEQRIRTLMHDPVYRLGIAWQNVGYNQPPHTSFFLGHNMDAPPVPSLYLNNVIPATVDVNPNSIDTKQTNGNVSLTVNIGLDKEHEVSEINSATVKMVVNGKTIFAESHPSVNGEKSNKLMVKFDRQQVSEALKGYSGTVQVNINGFLHDGESFNEKAELTLK